MNITTLWVSLASILSGYLIGSISFSRLIIRLFSPSTDPQSITIKDESAGIDHQRTVNATTMSMVLGWKAGCLISLLDMLKVTVPTLLIKSLFPDQPYFLLTALSGLIGNNWPIYYRFKGGSGISAIYGGLLIIDPLAIFASAIAGAVIGLGILRSMGVMFVLSLLLIIPWLWFRFQDWTYLAYGVLANLFYLIPFIRDARQFLVPGRPVMSESKIMAQMPMGRGMMQMMDRLGLKMGDGLAGQLKGFKKPKTE